MVWWELGWGVWGHSPGRGGDCSQPGPPRAEKSEVTLPACSVPGFPGLGTRTVCAEDTYGFCHRSLLSGWWNPDTLPYRNRRLAQFPFGVQKSSEQTTGLRFGAKTSGRIPESVGAGALASQVARKLPRDGASGDWRTQKREGESLTLGGVRRPPKGTLGNVRRHLRLSYLDVWGQGAPGTWWGETRAAPQHCAVPRTPTSGRHQPPTCQQC